jgi:xanthine/uracil permease
MKTIHFLATVLTALALIPGGAHLLELPNKLGLGQEAYFAVQGIYRGWALAGAVIIAAIVMNLVVAIARWRNRRAFRLSISAFLLLGFTLGIFFAFTEPQNKATAYWTSIPTDWEQVRLIWEYSHAANAVLTFLALCCAVGACLTGWSPALERAERQRAREIQREMQPA